MSSKIDRKAELQRKKERLAQIRAGKQMKLKQEVEFTLIFFISVTTYIYISESKFTFT